MSANRPFALQCPGPERRSWGPVQGRADDRRGSAAALDRRVAPGRGRC